jgi:hypothetical protein
MMGQPMSKADRYRDFFDLQLRFAEAAAVQTSTPMADAVLLYTNFHRRFGLGDVSRDGLNPAWSDYACKLAALDSHEQRAGWTQAFYAQVSEERPASSGHIFGCFEFDADEETGIVRPHFYNRDPSGALGRARAGERRRELQAMFACLKRRFPTARRVEGRSWLYGTEAYRRLFPEDYVRSRAVIEGASRFQGMAWWGQFLDREGNVKQPLRDALLRNLDRLNANRLWEAFPLPAFRVSAPIDSFYAAYGI